MRRSFSLLLFFVLFPAACNKATPPVDPPPGIENVSVSISTSLESAYQPGDSDSSEISVKIDDPDKALQNAVIFLAVTERLGGGSYRIAPEILADGSVEPNIFQTVYSGKQLRKGLSSKLSFKLSDTATPSGYALVIQVFNGTETNPNLVKIENRIGSRTFRFDIVE